MTELQRTDEWHAARLGKLTASRFHEAVATTAKSGWSASRKKYMAQLLAERLTGRPYERYQSQAMRDGTEREPDARIAYALDHDVEVIQCGFVDHPRIAMAGCSPDGLVGTDGLVEIKCPETHTHIEYLTGVAMPGEYLLQMQWQMACTGRAWCDWVSFEPRLPAHLQLHVRRMHRDEQLISGMEQQAIEFLAELDRMVARLEPHRRAA